MKKYRAYIDGFNVYHGLDNFIRSNSHLNKKFSWVNPRKMVSHFIDKQTEILDKVYFFSAIPNQKEEDTKNRHKLYYDALRHYCDVEIINGYFQRKNKKVKCPPKKYGGCEKHFNFRGYEEKQTDVSLGIQIIRDAFVDNIDGIILVSADSDFIPVVNMLLKETNIQIKILKPLGQQKNYAYLNMIKHHKNYSVHDILEFHNKTSIMPDRIHISDTQAIINPYL